VEVSQLASSDQLLCLLHNSSGNESRPLSPPKMPGAGPSHKKYKNEESISSEKRDKSSNYKIISNSEQDRKYLAHAGAGTAGAAAMALAHCSTLPSRAKAAARRGRRGPAAATPSPAGKVVDLIGDDCDDENDAAATPGGVDRGTTGGCGSDRRSGQSIDPSEAESGRIVENGDEDSIDDDEGGDMKGIKERGRVKRKEEEASSKEHDGRRKDGAPPRMQRPRRSPCLRDHTDPPRINTTMTIEPVHEIEINSIKHPCPHFEYDPNNQNVEEKCALRVDGKKMFVDFHDLTKKERGRDGSRPRPIINSSVAKKLNPPIIDDTGGDKVRIKFPNGRRNTVFFARKDSKCDILKQMYEFISRNKNCFELLNQMVPSHLWEEDTLAGGKYLPMGISLRNGTQGSNSKLPFLRQASMYNVCKKLEEFYAHVCSFEAMLMDKYCGEEYIHNRETYAGGDDCIFPSPTLQKNCKANSRRLYLCLNQIALRIMDNKSIKNKHNPERTALHVDAGDVDSDQFLTFMPMGNNKNSGGRVANSDLIVFENQLGGLSYRLRTAIGDTVVILLMNSSKQLHGNVEDSDSDTFDFEESVFSARLIGYGCYNVQKFIERRKKGEVRGEAFLGVVMKKHKPLQKELVKAGHAIVAEFGKKRAMYPAELIEQNDGLYLRWDEGSISKLLSNGRVYSSHCAKSKPHYCQNCNPHAYFTLN